MPLSRDLVQPRLTGLVELTDEAVIRFGSVEPHQVMKAALATADLYGPVLEAERLPDQAVLAMSCFALHAGWTPGRLAAGTRYTSYYTVGASTVHDLGYEVWATDTFTEGEPDPTNPVHFDIVIQRNIPLDVLADRTGTPAQRRDLRNRFLPELERLLGRLDGPRPLDDDESYDLDPWRLP
jgi:hypothetical protein